MAAGLVQQNIRISECSDRDRDAAGTISCCPFHAIGNASTTRTARSSSLHPLRRWRALTVDLQNPRHTVTGVVKRRPA